MNRPGQDMLLQAMSGAMLNVGRASDPPAPAGTYAVDAITGYGAFEGALAGLLHRERTGEGQLVTVNMLDSAIAVQAQELSIYTVGGIPQHRGREVHGHTYIRAPYGTFATADGYLALAFPPLAQLGEVLGIPEFAGLDDDVDGHTRRDEITALVRARLPERGTAEWLAEFDARGIWAGPVYDYADVLADPQVRHNGSLVSYDHPTEGRVTTPGFPYRFSATPPEVYRGAPLTGEQPREILAELGYDGESVDRLAAAGVVTAPGGTRGQSRGVRSERPVHRGAARPVTSMTVRLTGLTWDHPRGYLVLDALAGTLEPDVSVRWRRQPLEGFESRPLRTLAGDFDLLVVDHPGLGEAVRDGTLLPLDELFGEQELAAWRTGSVGASYDSYVLDEQAVGAAAGRRRAGRGGPAGPDGRAPRQLGAGPPGGPRLPDHAVPGRAARAADVQRDLRGGRIAPGGGVSRPGPAGTESAGADGPFVSEVAGTAALAVMADLLACADRELSQCNPIGVLDAMACSGGPPTARWSTGT